LGIPSIDDECEVDLAAYSLYSSFSYSVVRVNNFLASVDYICCLGETDEDGNERAFWLSVCLVLSATFGDGWTRERKWWRKVVPSVRPCLSLNLIHSTSRALLTD
jgi:hypothetical protein